MDPRFTTMAIEDRNLALWYRVVLIGQSGAISEAIDLTARELGASFSRLETIEEACAALRADNGRIGLVVIDRKNSSPSELKPIHSMLSETSECSFLFVIPSETSDSDQNEILSWRNCDTLEAPLKPLLIKSKIKLHLKLFQNLKQLGLMQARQGESEQFARVAFNELLQPIRAISAHVQLIEENCSNQLSGEARIFMEYISSGVRRLNELIENLSSFEKSTRETPSMELLDFNEVMRDVLQDIRSMIEDARAVVEFDSLPRIRGYRSQIYQLFQNLVCNAIKYRGQESPCIHIGAYPMDQEWLFSIQDDGVGFDPSSADRIFSLFERLECTANRPGRGIGLAICRRIVERHGGKIWAKSNVGEGSTFYFTLPQTQLR